jgi:hypothetical protein
MGAGTEAKTAPNFPAAQVCVYAFNSMGSRKIQRKMMHAMQNAGLEESVGKTQEK